MVDIKSTITKIKDWQQKELIDKQGAGDDDLLKLQATLDDVKRAFEIGGDVKTSDYINLLNKTDIKKAVDSAGKKISSKSTEGPTSQNAANRLRDMHRKRIEQPDTNNSYVSMLYQSESERFVLYNNYKTIVDLVPFLDKMLNTFVDNIISPDDNTKKSLNIVNNNNKLDEDVREEFNDNCILLNRRYKTDIKVMKYIRNSLKIGDEFILVLKMSDELNGLFIKEDGSITEANNAFFGGSIGMNVLTEDTVILDENEQTEVNQILTEINKQGGNSFSENDFKHMVAEAANMIDYTENPMSIIGETVKYIKEFKKDKPKPYNAIIKQVLSGNKTPDGMSDGITFDDFNGSIIRKLQPERVIKIQKDDYCYGYYYIEDIANQAAGLYSMQKYGTLYNLFSSGRYNIETMRNKDELIYNVFVKNVAKRINKQFIVDNKEIKDSIIAVMKHNKLFENRHRLRFTYLSDSNVVHFRGDDVNETSIDDSYGTSVFKNILFTAKIYIAVLANTLMVKLVRGTDKRVFYLQSGVEKAHEAVLDEFIDTMKLGALKMADLNDINYVLRVVGEFEDYYIPVFDGERPLEMEILQGQDVDVKNDFLEYLRSDMYSGVNMPAALHDNLNDVQFARILPMENAIFASDIITKQKLYTEPASKFIRLLYENEFLLVSEAEKIRNDKLRKELEKPKINKSKKSKDKKKSKVTNNTVLEGTEIKIEDIEVMFPPPASLNYQNTNDLITSAQTIIDTIINAILPDDKEFPNDETGTKAKQYVELRNLFRLELNKRYIASIPWLEYEQLVKELDKRIIKEEIRIADKKPQTGENEFSTTSEEDTGAEETDTGDVNPDELEGDGLSGKMDDILP